MQSLSPKRVRWLGHALPLLMVGCGAPPPPASEVPPNHAVARAAVIQATVALRAAQRRRDGRAEALRRQPADPCEPMVSQARATWEAWEGLGAAWARYEGVVADAAGRRAQAQRARAQVARSAAVARREAAGWARWCAERRPVHKPALGTPHRPERCGDTLIRGPVVNRVEPSAKALAGPEDTAALLERLRRDLQADWEVVLLFDEATTQPASADRAVLRVAGRAAVEGADPRHVPGWGALLGVAPLAAADLGGAATLRGLLRVMAPPRAFPSCGRPARIGWGTLTVGGLLGGPRPDGLVVDGERTWRLVGPTGAAAGLLANGGDGVPYAPHELALLGLGPATGLPAVRGLRRPTRLAPGRVRALGECEVSARELLGPTPGPRRAAGPFRIGVVLRTRRPLPASTLARWADGLAELAAPHPDALPDRLNFHEATGGRGRLRPVAAYPSVACGDGTPPVPSAP